ncbi:MAG TPA: alpha-2-macroglobulin family protein [Fimbriimonadaceae bacterium]|nr:alpha-2-macroglobulin family protein [Fimbriimonadaceae bacterium]
MKGLNRGLVAIKGLSLLASLGIAGGLLSAGITEEVPMGGLQGKVMLKENGRAISGVALSIGPISEEEDDAYRQRTMTSDESGHFSIKNIPAGTYKIYAYAKAHRLEGQRVTIGEGEPTVLELAMNPSEPYLDLNTSQKVFLPSEQPSFQADGFLASEKVSIDIYKLNLTDIVKKGSVRDLLEGFSRYASRRDEPEKYGKKVRTVSHSFSNRDAEGVFVETVSLESLPEGFYWVRCRAKNVDRGTYVNVSTIGMVTKSGEKDTMCYVADLQSGQPISDAAIGLATDQGLKQVGITSPSGTVHVGRTAGEHQLLVAKKGESVALVDYYSRSGDNQAGSGRVFLYSDRPIYRPGDTIEFKGIARVLSGVDFAVPRQGKVKVEVKDPDENLIKSFDLNVSNRGTFNGSFATNREAKPGNYRLTTTGPGGEGTLDISIAAYRKPEFKITVEPLKDFYVFGEPAQMRIKCEYYHGGPVVGAKIDAYVSRAPSWTWMDEEGEMYSDDSGSGEGLDNLEAVSDANGEAIVEFDTSKPEEENYGSDTDYLYTLSVSAADEGDKYFEGEGSVKVTRGLFDTGVEASDYIGDVGKPVEIKVHASSHAEDKPLSGIAFKIVAGEENWSGDKVHFEPLDTLQATTGPDGSGTVTYTPRKAGSLVFKATAVDEQKHEIESSTYFYVEGAGVPARPGGKLTVTLDKKKYEVGETARALIQTDKPGGFALFTVEADEVLYESVVNLTQSVTIVQIPVTKQFAPNAQVAVAYIREKQFYEAGSSMVLNLSEQKLQVAVVPDREKVLPGQTVTYFVTTKDKSGQPVSADLSLAVVDESIYAIMEDSTDPFIGFFPRRNVSVVTSYSFPEIYLDGGDKGAGNVPIRTLFKDTAFWAPSVQTDATGSARVSVTLPDNLTTWRATVVAVTDRTAVGMATEQVVASKPLMIKLQTPQFMVVQDQQKVTATVQNDTGQAADVRVGVTPTGITLDGQTSQTIRVEPGKPQTIEWTATAQRTGQAELVATAEIAGGANDGVKSTFEVKAHGREFQSSDSGIVKGEASFNVTIRDGADPNSGRLVVSLSPSIASTLVQSLDGLVDYPYGCVEQTMSRFLPAILVDQALGKLGLSRPDLRAKVPAIAADGLTRLAKMQHGDGGWGWWEFDDSDPFMTALVLDGLHRARLAGLRVDQSMIDRALDWSQKRLNSDQGKKDIARDRVYLGFALASNGRTEAAASVLKADSKAWRAPELAIGAMTARLVGNEELAMSFLRKLKAQAKATPQVASWAEEPYSWGQESTALALAALVELDPQSDLIPKVVRYLMTSRKGEYWSSTRDTAYVLIGMTSYLAKTKELSNPNGSLIVSVNGKEVQRVIFDRNSILQPELQVTVPMSELHSGANEVKISQAGNSVCYYTADLKQIIPDDKLGELVASNDLKVERAYYRMEAKRMEDGTLRFRPSDRIVEQIQSGEVIKVVVKIHSGRERQFVMVEDPVPSNCRVTERDEPYEDEEWGWWWARTVIRDDRVSFFARTLPSGDSEFTYFMRAESDGKSNALPTRVGNMYDPEDYASTREIGLEVQPR